MTGFFIFLHTIVCLILITVILMQSGRGGGLTEGFSSAESMFGAQTNEFMIKATTILSTVFLVTCLALAVLSIQKGQSLIPTTVVPTSTQSDAAKTMNKTVDEAVKTVEQAAEQPQP
ncbi:MAG: preprotein translocase subunit SecG [Candidatus Omnitrophica bacterium]|nr:preprotein translocase subunit SecG [Candidatus Omnitrophota bacterium]